MRIGFHQPAFIPWGGFWARLAHVDKMILLDDTLLARGFTFVNRNRLKGPNGEIWITVPLKRKGRGRQKIRDLEIHEKPYWAKRFLATLRHYYGKSIYFESLFSEISKVVNDNNDYFLPMIESLLLLLREAFGLKTPLIKQSDLGITGQGTELLISIADYLKADEVLLSSYAVKHVDLRQFRQRGIKVFLHFFDMPQYPQFWGEFCPNLSALDLYFCLGPNGLHLLEKASRIQPWP
ncbi:MAG: WbqC family protein [Candidatus Aminicenantes bacterium]|nr:WbqC family protein [Candidatus Aminicenantes bacterium]